MAMASPCDIEDRRVAAYSCALRPAVGRIAARHTRLLTALALSLSHVVAVRREEP